MISESDLIEGTIDLEESMQVVCMNADGDVDVEATRQPMRSQAERNKLVEEHIELAENEAKKRFRSVSNSVLFGELLSAAYSGLLDAAEKFDETKVNSEAKRPFPCYARQRIQGEMNDYLRSCNWGTRSNPRKIASLDSTNAQPSWDDAPRPLRDMLTSSVPSAIDQLNGQELFDKVIRGLPPGVKEAFRLRFVNGLTMKEVAVRLDISESRVSQILSQHTDYLSRTLAGRRCEYWEEAMEVKYA